MFGGLFGKPKILGKALLIAGDTRVHQGLAESWGWLIGDKKPLHFSACGDVFLTDAAQAVEWLETTTGKLTRLVDSVSAFEELLKQRSFCDGVLQAPLVEQLRAQLGPLPPVRCYSYKMMPVLGGSEGLENRAILPLYEHVGLNGDIRLQVKDLPPGATIQIKVVD